MKPGMVVKAKVIAVDSFGAIVQLASGVKALCPLRHMSEFEITKPRKKFEVVNLVPCMRAIVAFFVEQTSSLDALLEF